MISVLRRSTPLAAAFWLWCCALVHPFEACGAPRTDALGRSISLDRAPERIVSLAPSVTEIIFALGADDRLVGVTQYCDYPPAAARKAKVGSYADPGLEGMVALQPDLVIAGADQTKPMLVDRLSELGIPVFLVYPRSFAETLETIRAVGQLIGVEAAGHDLAETMQEEAAAVQRAVAGRRSPRVLLCIMARPLVVAGAGTLGGDLIRLAGGVNVTGAGGRRYPTWGPEAVLAAAPEVVVVASMTEADSQASFYEEWPELGAGSRARVRVVQGDWLHRAGPRLVMGLRALAEALHPDPVPESPQSSPNGEIGR